MSQKETAGQGELEVDRVLALLKDYPADVVLKAAVMWFRNVQRTLPEETRSDLTALFTKRGVILPSGPQDEES